MLSNSGALPLMTIVLTSLSVVHAVGPSGEELLALPQPQARPLKIPDPSATDPTK